MSLSRTPEERSATRSSLVALRRYIERELPRAVRTEVECTCGAPYHARLIPIRVHGQRAVAVIPEGATIGVEELRAALGSPQVERLQTEELEPLFAGLASAGTAASEAVDLPTIFFDEALLAWPEIVFCPRMFWGQPGECFRIPTRAFLELSCAILVPLTPAHLPAGEEWGV
ncbi:MAG: hypothetical protein K6U09_04100 [Acidobacteriia bacterium]|jgi:hypothetical protein|nr:hypothetical protein [Terriglobia bacterium]